MLLSIHAPNLRFLYLNYYFLTYEGVPKIQDCVVVLQKRHLAEKIFIYVKTPMHINSPDKFQLGFSKFQIFKGRSCQQSGTASVCQISSKSLEPQPRNVSFNIMLVWLENAYSCPFWAVFGAHFPQMMPLIVLTPKRTILWLNHVIWVIYREYFPIDFWMGLTWVLYFPLV